MSQRLDFYSKIVASCLPYSDYARNRKDLAKGSCALKGTESADLFSFACWLKVCGKISGMKTYKDDDSLCTY
jgi:hypothetical protein